MQIVFIIVTSAEMFMIVTMTEKRTVLRLTNPRLPSRFIIDALMKVPTLKPAFYHS